MTDPANWIIALFLAATALGFTIFGSGVARMSRAAWLGSEVVIARVERCEMAVEVAEARYRLHMRADSARRAEIDGWIAGPQGATP